MDLDLLCIFAEEMKSWFQLFFLCFLLWIANKANAQVDLYVGGELTAGILTGIDSKANLLKQKNYSPTIGVQVNGSIRIYDRLTIEGGFGQHRSNYRFRDEDFEEIAEDFSVNIDSRHYYWNYFFGGSISQRIKQTDTYLYGRFIFSYNIIREESVSENSSFGISSLDIDRTVDFKTDYKPSLLSFIPEIGVQHKFYKGNLLSFGLKYQYSKDDALISTYTVTDNVSKQQRTDVVNSTLNAISFNLKFDFRLHHFSKKEKVKKFDLDEIAIDLSKPKEQSVDTTPPTTIENRDLIINESIIVHSPKVKVFIWDHQTEDGDRISVNLNNEWIIENYTLKKEKYLLEIELREGINTFVMHALNLGKVRPNTAAMIVDDGEKEHKIVLQSNLKESGTLQIKYKKRNEKK